MKIALESHCFDRVIVSTDDPEIADIVQKYGAEVPFLRPAELADDYTGTLAVVNHALSWLYEDSQNPDYVCVLYATAPFIQAETLQHAFNILTKNKPKLFCFGVTEFPSPIQRAIKISKQGNISMFQPDYFESRSQDLEKAYHDAGQFYWGKTKGFFKGERMFSEHSIPYILPSYLVQDIDTPDDWVRAEVMYKVLQTIRKP